MEETVNIWHESSNRTTPSWSMCQSFQSENHYTGNTQMSEMTCQYLGCFMRSMWTQTRIERRRTNRTKLSKPNPPPPKKNLHLQRSRGSWFRDKRRRERKTKNLLVRREKKKNRKRRRTVERGPFWMSSVSLATGPRPSKAPWAHGLFERSPLFSAASFITVTT